MPRLLFDPSKEVQTVLQRLPKQEPKQKDVIGKLSDIGRTITSFTGGEKIGEFLGATIASTPLLGKFVTGIELTSEERDIVQRGAPSTTDVLKSAAGAALQTGSAAIGGSVGGLAKLGLGARAIQGARIGGTAGATFGAGEAVSEEKGIGGIAKGAAIGGAFGGTVGLVFPLGIAGTGATYRFGANALRQVHQLIKPGSRKTAVNGLADAFEKSFVSDNPTVTKSLRLLSDKSSKGGQVITRRVLLRELAEDGYMPRVEGKLANFDEALVDLSERREAIAEGLDTILGKMQDVTIPLTRLLQRTKSNLRASPQISATLNRALREVDTVFESFQSKFGKELSPRQVNRIRVEMNRLTKSFKGDQFVQDAADSTADAARSILDNILPSGTARQANAEIGKLFRMTKTINILNNRPINVGILGGQVGRYIAVVGATGIGFTAGGPGGLVVAGIAANFGAARMAQLLRALRFNDRARQIIIEGLQKDRELLEKLVREASEEDAQYILRQVKKLLPAPSGRPSGVSEIRLPGEGVLKGQETLRKLQR